MGIIDIHIAAEILEYLMKDHIPKDWNSILLVKSILNQHSHLHLQLDSDPFLKHLFGGPGEIHERIKMST
jgi:hypothetical protein